MKTIQSYINIYTVILLATLCASIWQMSLLGKGLAADINLQAPVADTAPVAKTAPVATVNNTTGFKPERIVIDKVGIDLPVVSVPLKNGTWAVNPHVANYAEGTDLINDKSGNVGIYGHARADAFVKIRQMLTGYDIMLISNSYRAIYRVQRTSVIAPTAVDVFSTTKEPVLTLITCEGTLSEKRYMVRAKLIKIEKINK